MAKIEILVKADHPLGESIVWHEARRCLFWIDLYDPMLCAHDLATGVTTNRKLDLPAPIGAIAATSDPDILLLAHCGGLSLLNINDLSMVAYLDPERGRNGIIFNDMKVDRWGRLWVGSSDEREILPRGALWCVKSATDFALADVGFPTSNGPAFSPDGQTMYFSDSVKGEILAYTLSKQDLKVRQRRVFAKFSEEEGAPDGLTVDQQGHVWCAMWNGASVFKLSAQGEKLDRIAVPALKVTSVCVHRSVLYITSARENLAKDTLEKYPLSGSVFKLTTQDVEISETLFPL
jgi:xylono-1,5-lactonase